MVEILCFVCSLLWIIKFLWELHFHWIMEYFVILEHVVYHAYHHVYCLPLCNVWEEITNHDNRTAYRTHYIPFDRFHDKLWVKIYFIIMSKGHGGTLYVCILNRFSKCQCFALLFLLLQLKRQWCLECILKLEGFAKTKGFLMRSDLQKNNPLMFVYSLRECPHNVNYFYKKGKWKCQPVQRKMSWFMRPCGIHLLVGVPVFITQGKTTATAGVSEFVQPIFAAVHLFQCPTDVLTPVFKSPTVNVFGP